MNLAWLINIQVRLLFYTIYCVVVYGVSRRFQQYFSFIVAVSFIVGGKNRRTRRKSPPVASHWQTLSHNVVSSTLCYEFYYWMLFSVTLVTLNIFVLHFNIFLFCWCNICILCMIIPMQFLSKILITVYEENVDMLFCKYKSS
jgi:hypothetical protein